MSLKYYSRLPIVMKAEFAMARKNRIQRPVRHSLNFRAYPLL
jgi:hypothetical protein